MHQKNIGTFHKIPTVHVHLAGVLARVLSRLQLVEAHEAEAAGAPALAALARRGDANCGEGGLLPPISR